jgi:hypothetical protein
MEITLILFAGYYGIIMLIGGISDYFRHRNDFRLYNLLGGLALCTGLAVYLLSVEVKTFINETLRSTENCAEWYAEEFYDAAEDGDIGEFRDLKECMTDWILHLDVEDLEKFDRSVKSWSNNNKAKIELIISFESKYNL